ncbi:MAG: hypothetical protein KatS3mg054_0634 [Chloroflexus sp.]|nr:MAG: hypothetical protein KatS3mg054_0634 [Chloroflexus sp.]
MNGCKVYYAGYIMQPGVDVREYQDYYGKTFWLLGTTKSMQSCSITAGKCTDGKHGAATATMATARARPTAIARRCSSPHTACRSRRRGFSMRKHYRLLDLFCGAGGAAMGYYRAGFDVTGVDIADQPRYPFRFARSDALDYLDEHYHEYDVIHASPPCQSYTRIRGLVESRLGRKIDYPDLVSETRLALEKTGLPYVIENVPGAPIRPDIKLNGLMFGLRVLRERWFETNWFDGLQPLLPKKPRGWKTNAFRGMSGFKYGADLICVCGANFVLSDAKIAMGIDWMSKKEISQAIPPAYTYYIGSILMEILEQRDEP